MGRPRHTNPKIQISPSGRYYARPSIPKLTLKDGLPVVESIQETVYFDEAKTLTEAKRLLSEYCREINRTPSMLKSQIPFSDVVKKYREIYLPSLRESTRTSYQSRIDKHILPAFAKMKLAEIDKMAVQAWLNGIEGTANAKHRCLSTLASIFERANEWDWHAGRNPAKGLKVIATREPRSLRSLEPHEVNRLLAALSPALRTLCILILFTGIRIGEARGLQWRDIQPPQIIIRRNRAQRSTTLGPTKKNKVLTLALDNWIAEKLFSLRPDQARPEDCIFDTEYYELQKELRLTAAAIGLKFPGFGFHTLRSTHATWKDYKQVNTADIQQALGHSSANMTRRYIRPSINQQLEVSRRLLDMLEGGKVQ